MGGRAKGLERAGAEEGMSRWPLLQRWILFRQTRRVSATLDRRTRATLADASILSSSASPADQDLSPLVAGHPPRPSPETCAADLCTTPSPLFVHFLSQPSMYGSSHLAQSHLATPTLATFSRTDNQSAPGPATERHHLEEYFRVLGHIRPPLQYLPRKDLPPYSLPFSCLLLQSLPCLTN